ncbi:16S rRNA (guanine(966)-N(2))-methyltransferase RsmD [Angelakisella massiliensis]|uniref:16S rRNA (guanine(966)-N(2))-methyltransferase RsmD n=1 Tax=Angelakisella massiliensis TaxID=1871018 RepID=UPI0008F88A3F|nr:16S rRNA (guanine(966)-N(2))-methyltransferase RsmD [Angelakisella massiliensis]
MRVITGTARGRKLVTLEGMDVRPTTDMVKEAMFSILQFEVEGASVADLFCGSGQLGIEALSRGARYCVFVDQSRDSQNITRQNLQSTGLAQNSKVAAMDCLSFLRTTSGGFDIVLMDPPYGKGLAAAALPLAAEKMSPGGVILCETGKEEELPEQAGDFVLYRTYRYGKIKLWVYRRGQEEENA